MEWQTFLLLDRSISRIGGIPGQSAAVVSIHISASNYILVYSNFKRGKEGVGGAIFIESKLALPWNI